LRIAFVGQGRYFLAASFEGRKGKISGKFFDLDSPNTKLENLLSDLVDYSPDLVVFYRPDFFLDTSNAIFDLQVAPVVGFLTEPIGSAFTYGVDNLRSRRKSLRTTLSSLRLNYIFCFTHELADFVSKYKIVTSVMPLPVNDVLFSRPRTSEIFSKIVFVGRINEYRKNILQNIKHAYDPLVIDNGVTYPSLKQILPDKNVIAINIHVGRMRTFEHRALVHMAMGHLVISQKLFPSFGILPNCEYLIFQSGLDLEKQIEKVKNNPELAQWIAARGNDMANRHIASEVWANVYSTILQFEKSGIGLVENRKL
jgi:hypothetical protein